MPAFVRVAFGLCLLVCLPGFGAEPQVMAYAESFETYAVGFSIAEVPGWGAKDPVQTIVSTNDSAGAALASYRAGGGTYPLDGPHAQVLSFSSDVSNRFGSVAGQRVRTDFLLSPALRTVPPPDDSAARIGLYFDTNGVATIWRRVFPGTGSAWLTLTNSPAVTSGAWVRVTFLQDLSNNLFQVSLNNGPPLSDAAGWSGPGGTQPGSWFHMAQTNSTMSTLAFEGQGQAYLDDLSVVSDPPQLLTLSARNVTVNSAELAGRLAFTGTEGTAVEVYWGTTDGGTNTSAWAHTNVWSAPQSAGIFFQEIGGLASNVVFYRYALVSEEGRVWSADAETVVPGEVTVTASDAQAVERINPIDPGIFRVERPAWSTNAALTVWYTLGGTAANGADYAPVDNSVMIPAGATGADVTITPLVDRLSEGIESVVLTLRSGAYVIGTSAEATVNISDPEWALARRESLPQVALRGYGPVQGEYAVYTSATGTTTAVLRVQTSGNEQGRITAAKYARDIEAFGATVPPSIAPQRIGTARLWSVPCQGWLSVRRQGSEVNVVAAASRDDLEGIAQLLGVPSDEPDADAVPMYLDAWDRYGFRFYYRPWEVPSGTNWAGYAVMDEFDFAQQVNAGFVFWATLSEADTAEGINNNVWWDWAARAAARRGLPAVININIATPTWLLNRYSDQRMMMMPGFCGSKSTVADSGSGGMRSLSWCATRAEDVQLAQFRSIVAEYAAQSNTLEFLEPHGELQHGAHDIFLEYGPLADANYREFLRTRYGDLATLSQRWRGTAGTFQSWDEVHVPEVASFLGYDAQALDLQGTWRLAYAPTNVLSDWFQPGFDDSAWAETVAPGNDRFMHMNKESAVFRRTFAWPPPGGASGASTWLYVWDLNLGAHLQDKVAAYVNGVKVGETFCLSAVPHWLACEVTSSLQAGTNTIAVQVPKGFLGYRIYLASTPPDQYPKLGAQKNAQWVDFCDWRRGSRVTAVRRGMAMIRGTDPNRSIVAMAPDSFFSGIRQASQDFGAHFHNTGHMGGFWNDYLPMLMRGADLPFSLEPGGPAADLASFKNMLGFYFTEGIQAIHYFIHIGDVFWKPEIKAHFESIQPLIQTIGKVHPPKAEVAMLFSDRVNALVGYPWGTDYNVNLPSGYWGWRFSDSLVSPNGYYVDAVTDLDFATNTVDAYRVVLDTNTSIMDPALVSNIEAWVRRGGIFVTVIQTGRHTPEEMDAWPINTLTGYRVTAIDPHNADGSEARVRYFSLVPGQPIFVSTDWATNTHYYANGLTLEKVAPECSDLIRWSDGSIAAGLRPLGSGYVVHLGIKFGNGRGGGSDNVLMLRRVLEWANVKRMPAEAPGVLLRHYVSNNGLYDCWTMWNSARTNSVTTRLSFLSGSTPAVCVDLNGGTNVSVNVWTNGLPATAPLVFQPFETRILFTPRGELAAAPLDWFTLQRGWWRGAAEVSPLPAVAGATDGAHDLTRGWVRQTLTEGGSDDPTPFAASGFDDSAWPLHTPGCWAVPEELASRRVMLRKAFVVPAAWTNGTTTLWVRSWFSDTVVGTARYWVDGVSVGTGDGKSGLIQTNLGVAGSSHLLAMEVKGTGPVCGLRGNAWLSYAPNPVARASLAGDWTPSLDYLAWQTPITLPGSFTGFRSARRHIQVPAGWKNGSVALYVRGGWGIYGALVNGRYVRRHGHVLGDVTFLDVTPWLNVGGDNEIEILLPGGTERRNVYEAELQYFTDPVSATVIILH